MAQKKTELLKLLTRLRLLFSVMLYWVSKHAARFCVFIMAAAERDEFEVVELLCECECVCLWVCVDKRGGWHQ